MTAAMIDRLIDQASELREQNARLTANLNAMEQLASQRGERIAYLETLFYKALLTTPLADRIALKEEVGRG